MLSCGRAARARLPSGPFHPGDTSRGLSSNPVDLCASAVLSSVLKRQQHRLQPLGAHTQRLGRRALPPVVLGEDLHFDRAGVAGLLHPAADARKVHHAVAHHAAIQQQVASRHEPVADVEREQTRLPAGACDLGLEGGVPPHVVDVHGNADRAAAARIQGGADVERLLQRRQAGAIGAVHGMQRLERQGDAGCSGVLEQQAGAFQHLGARACQVLRTLRQPAHDHDKAGCSQLGGLVDGPAIVLDVGLERRAVRRRDVGAAAISAHLQPGVADALTHLLRGASFQLAPPGRNGSEPGARDPPRWSARSVSDSRAWRC